MFCDAAEMIGISYPTIKQWIYDGKIESVKTPGGHHRMLGFDKRMIRRARAHIRIKPKRFPHRHVQRFIAAALRSRDRSFQENARAAQGIPRFGRDTGGVARQINLLADVNRFDVEFRARRLQNMQSCRHNFRSDAVAVRDCDRSF